MNAKLPYDYELFGHVEQLFYCSSKWIVRKMIYADGTTEITAVPNICNNRDCVVCEDDRYKNIYGELKEITKGVKNLRLTTLTFGKNVDYKVLLNQIKRFRLYLYNFLRRLVKTGVKFSCIVVWEFKKQPNGQYHVHVHLAFAEVSPHHLTTSKEWAETLGVGWVDTDTKYRTQKSKVLSYLTRRIADAGLDKPPFEYLGLIKHRRLYSVVGDLLINSRLELIVRQLNKKNTENPEHVLVCCLTICKIHKWQNNSIPPPKEDLEKIVDVIERGSVDPHYLAKNKITISEDLKKWEYKERVCSGGVRPEDVPTSPLYRKPCVLSHSEAQELWKKYD